MPVTHGFQANNLQCDPHPPPPLKNPGYAPVNSTLNILLSVTCTSDVTKTGNGE